jgi:hypothetical protein
VCFQGIESSGDGPIEADNFRSFPVGIAGTLRDSGAAGSIEPVFCYASP